MLTLIVAFIALACQGTGQVLTKKLVGEAQKAGWTYTAPESVDVSAPKNSVDCRLAHGMHYVRVQVTQVGSRAAAAKELKALMATSARRTVIEELALKGTGLTVDVDDFSTKRISNMKAYAAGNMRVTGTVKNTAVFLEIEAPPAGVAPMTKPKSEEQVYDDVIGFAKLIATELKKP